MSLLMDGELSSAEDLRAHDGNVMEVAAAERVDLKSKMELAQREIEIEVEAFLREEECGTLAQVVATPAMKRWHALLTLEHAYRDAYFSQLNDRFGGRWKAFGEAARKARDLVMENGVGLVSWPLPRPTRMRTRVEPGPNAPASYWLAMAWVRGEEESALSAVEAVMAAGQHWLVVEASRAPSDATGWRVYAGTSHEDLRLQNASPLALEQTWTMPSGGIVDGPAPTGGQAASFYCVRRLLLRRR